jgi:DNA sulfur modification protein DndD
MKISRVVMEDFRSFYGRHELTLSEDEVRRVTVIHAENGGGKTNFLNAIYWCVTGKFTPRFKFPNILINKSAYAEGKRTCSVEMSLRALEEGPDVEYTIRRVAANDREKSLAIFQVKEGNATPIYRPEAFLSQIFPPGLVDWFFFDAEAIGALSLSGGEEFKRGIRKVLGFEFVDDFLSDLDKAQLKLQRELGSLGKNARVEELAQEIDNIETIIPTYVTSLNSYKRELARHQSRVESVRSTLSSLPQSRELERRRAAAEQRRQRLLVERRGVISDYATLIGVSAPASLLLPLVEHLEDKLQDEEVKGRLPAPYSDQLVKDILDSSKCICGRVIEENTSEYRCITDLLEFASTSEINEKLSDVRYLIRTIERVSADYPNTAQSILNRSSAIETQLSDCEGELRDISEKLSQIDQDEVSRLESEKRKLDQEISRVERQIGGLERDLNDARRNEAEKRAAIELATKTMNISSALSKTLNRLKTVKDFISEKLLHQEKQSLKIFSIELNNVLDKTFTKTYRATINPRDYRIELFDSDNHLVPDSTGEGQVLKFSFVSTMVALAAKKTIAKLDWIVTPTIAPLVLDAPFSALDDDYQAQVAKTLAGQTTQLILMISSAHWTQKVEANLRASTGKRYLFISHNTDPQNSKLVKTILIGDVHYAMNVYDAEVNCSFIEELPV